MELIVLFVFEMLISNLLKFFLIDVDTLSLLFIIINSIIFPFYIYKKTNNKNLMSIIFIGYTLRCFLLLVDYYWFRIPPHSGFDTEAFHGEAIKIYNNFNYIWEADRGLYAKFLGILYIVMGPKRLLAQYLNVIFGIVIVININDILNVLCINKKLKEIIMILVTFFPHNIIFSSILLREVLVGLGISSSLKYFIYWIKDRRIKYIILTIFTFLIGAAFHSGVIAILFAYILGFAFYSHREKRLLLNIQQILIFIIIIIVGTFVFINYGEIFLGKFKIAEDKEFMFSWMSKGRGASSYLGGLEINNFFEMILYSPLKMIYFLFSPMPWDFRGIIDMFSFILDSILYVYIIYYITENYKKLNDGESKAIVYVLLIGILLSVFILGYGTFNSGTAMRHRNKILTVLITISTVIKNERSIKE